MAALPKYVGQAITYCCWSLFLIFFLFSSACKLWDLSADRHKTFPRDRLEMGV